MVWDEGMLQKNTVERNKKNNKKGFPFNCAYSASLVRYEEQGTALPGHLLCGAKRKPFPKKAGLWARTVHRKKTKDQTNGNAFFAPDLYAPVARLMFWGLQIGVLLKSWRHACVFIFHLWAHSVRKQKDKSMYTKNVRHPIDTPH